MLMLLMVTLFDGRGRIWALEPGAIGLMTTGAGEGAEPLLLGEVGVAGAGEEATPGVARPARVSCRLCVLV